MFSFIKNKKTKKIIDTVFKALVVFAYFAVHIAIGFRHEAWRDESQCWVLAKNLSFSEILTLLDSEGHPFLWFLILKVVVATGLPFKYFCFFTTLMVTVAVYILMFHIELPLISKLCVVSSALLFYRNPIVSRTYALVVLLVFLLILFWKDRYKKPVLYGMLTALLFQSHIIMAGMGCGLLLILGLRCIKEKFSNKKLLIGTIIPLISLIILPIELFQRADTETLVHVSSGSVLTNISLESLKNAIFYAHFALFEQWGGRFYYIGEQFVLFVFIVSIWCCVVSFIKKEKRDYFDGSIVAFVSYCCGFSILGFVYAGTMQMRSTWFLGTTLFLWYTLNVLLERKEKFQLGIYLSVMFALSFGIVGRDAYRDYLYDHRNDSRPFAEYVTNNVPEGSVVLISEHFSISPGYAYLMDSRPDIYFYSVDKKAEYTAHYMGVEYDKLSVEEWNALLAEFSDSKHIYYWTTTEESTVPGEVLEDALVLYDYLSTGIEDSNKFYQIK